MSINAKRYLEKFRGILTLGRTIRSIRLCEEESQTAFSKKLKVSAQYLCDLEHNRKIISPKKAKKIAEILGYAPEQFVALALQDSLDRDRIQMLVEVKVA